MNTNPNILGDISDSSLNRQSVADSTVEKIATEPTSPYKRRKVVPTPNEDIYYKSYIPGRYGKLENLARLRRNCDQKAAQISELNTNIMTFKTQKQNIELENYKLDNDLTNVKQQLTLIQDQIDELTHHETQSLREIDQKYELTVQELKLNHETRLQKEKEKVCQQIEDLIGQVQRDAINKRERLRNECSEAEAQIKQQDFELAEGLKSLYEDKSNRLEIMQQRIDKEMTELKENLTSIQAQIDHQLKENETIEKQKLNPLIDQNKVLQNNVENAQTKFKDKQNEIKSLNIKVSTLERTLKEVEKSSESKANSIKQHITEINNKRAILQHVEQERRYLHNKYQELKGNIRVYCRIKPTTEKLINIEYGENDIDQSIVISKESDDDTDYSQHIQKPKSMYQFNFDKVFQPSTNNSEIFEELSQLVQSSLDGYNVCVFAYGQTGSGKTWTMSHPQDGMIPLTINKIFDDINEFKQSGWDYKVEGQFLEIYNDTIIDLLKNTVSPDTKYEIKHDDINGRTTISNLSSIELKSPQQALTVFTKSSSNRSTASTKANERSSRSHSIFILKISGYNQKTGAKCEGHLNLVDLAGSERLNNSQAKGDRLKETQHINKSLSSLGDVIFSLAQASKNSNTHIPYRNSKLTYLLKHSLGGNSKTLMFVNISPSLSNFGESLNSFRFATKVSNTKQGTIRGR